MASSKRDNRPDAFAEMLAALEESETVTPSGHLDKAMYGDRPISPVIAQAVKSNALVRGEDGGLRFHDVKLTGVGLVIPDNGVSQKTAKDLLEMLLRLEGSIQWLIGDILAYGERVYGETYREMAATFGRDYHTLENYAWVARNVNFSLRREKLTFGHHSWVAGFDVNSQLLWLETAAEMGWSIAKMRAFIGLLDVFDIEGQRKWLGIVRVEKLNADQLRARLVSAGNTSLEIIENDRDTVSKTTAAKRIVNLVERYGPDLVGASPEMVRDAVKDARAVKALADEILEKHGGQPS